MRHCNREAIIVPEKRGRKLVQDARQLISASRSGLGDRSHVEQTLAALNRSNEILSAMRRRTFDDLFAAPSSNQDTARRDTRAGQVCAPAPSPAVDAKDDKVAARKPMTAAQRRGLARKITAYLKRSGFYCDLIGDAQPRRVLN